MFEALFVVLGIAGALGLAYAMLVFAADYALPYFTRKPWRINRRPAATYKR